jgi:hypothetical protein
MVDTSKPGKGILASLENRAVAAPRRTPPTVARGPILVAIGGLLLAVVLAWWVVGGPSPLLVQDPLRHAALPTPLPPPAVAAHADLPHEKQAATIVNEETSTPASAAEETSRQVAAAALATTPIASVMVRSEPAARKPAAKPVRRDVAARTKPAVRASVPAAPRPAASANAPAQDSDVALLAALVAHANAGKRHRDEAPPADNAAAMLQRCASLAGEEHRVCRARICAAHPADTACRAP